MSATPTLTPDQQAAVIAFINQRPHFVHAMRNCPATALDDYSRWSGHAEARRHLATRLGLSVPHEPGQTTEPALTHARDTAAAAPQTTPDTHLDADLTGFVLDEKAHRSAYADRGAQVVAP